MPIAVLFRCCRNWLNNFRSIMNRYMLLGFFPYYKYSTQIDKMTKRLFLMEFCLVHTENSECIEWIRFVEWKLFY